MSGVPSTQVVKIACGAGGAFVDVTDDVMDLDGSLTYRWGVQDPTDAPQPGSFTLTLANPAGDYTPDSVLSSLDLPITDGMAVSWQLNDRIVTGRIRDPQLVFVEDGNPDAARVRVPVVDVVGDLALVGNDDRSLRGRYIDEVSSYHWSMDVPDGASAVFDTAGTGNVPMTIRGDRAKPGQQPIGGLYSWGTGVELNPTDATGRLAFLSATIPALGTSATTSKLGVAVRSTREPSSARVILSITGTGAGAIQYVMGKPSTGVQDSLVVGGVSFNMPVSMQVGQPYEIVITFRSGTGVVTAEIFGDNSLYGSVNNGAASAFSLGTNWGITVGQDAAPVVVERVYAGFGSAGSAPTHTLFGDKPTGIHARAGALATAAGLPGVEYVGSLTDLSTRKAGQQTQASSFLNAFADVIGIDGGRLFADVTTGSTVDAPVPVLKLVPGKSARSNTLAATFSTNDDINGIPEIVRGGTQRITQVLAESETARLVVLASDAGDLPTKGGTFRSPVYDPTELQALASDYMRRVNFSGQRIRSIRIDARGTKTDQWDAILNLYPGALVKVTDLPEDQFAQGDWYGWFIGATETHTAVSNDFVLYLEPYFAPPVFDTARFAADGDLKLTSGITSLATSFQVTSTGDLFTTNPANFPQKVVIDREVMTISAVSGASSPQTFTVSARGAVNADGVQTIARAHSAGAEVEVHPVSRFVL